MGKQRVETEIGDRRGLCSLSKERGESLVVSICCNSSLAMAPFLQFSLSFDKERGRGERESSVLKIIYLNVD